MASWVNLLDIVYPIGSVYISNSSTSPSSTIGGSWTQVTGKFIRGNNSNGSGNASTHTHVLGDAAGAQLDFGFGGSSFSIVFASTWNSNLTFSPREKKYIIGSDAGIAGEVFEKPLALMGSTNSSTAGNPAYKDFYIWYRTA